MPEKDRSWSRESETERERERESSTLLTLRRSGSAELATCNEKKMQMLQRNDHQRLVNK